MVVLSSNGKDKYLDFVIFSFIYIFFLLFAVVCAFPFYYLIINSISANDMSARGEVMFFPIGVHFNNFQDVFKLPGLGNAFFVSLSRTVFGTFLTVVGSSFLGYMFQHPKLWARKFWYRFVVVTMYFSAGLIPWFLTMRTLGLTNNFLAYILPAIAQPFYIILVKTYIENTPSELQHAAEIDGAGILYTYIRIILPISKPILATVAIFAAVGQWNSFHDTLILMTDPRLYTLQFILHRFLNQAQSLTVMIQAAGGMLTDSAINAATQQTPTSVQMTVAVVVILPILFVYPIFQRFFVKGIMLGSLKG